MMIAPEVLLQLEPLEALRLQIQEVLKAPLKASHLKIGKPVTVSGLKTRVEVSLDRSKAPLALWDRVGPVDLEYDRLDLGDFTRTINREVKASFPVSAYALLGSILSPYTIPVVQSDVMGVDYVNPTTATLLAGVDSYRWVGECDCKIVQLGLDITLLVKNVQFAPSFNETFNSLNLKETLAFSINLNNAQSLKNPINTSMFSLKTPVVNGAISEKNNTRIELEFTGLPYSGLLTVYYMRRGFDETFRYPVKLSGPQRNNKRELASTLSVQMGCTITESDLVNSAFPTLRVGEKSLISFTFDHTSLAYIGDILVEYTRTL